jgi:bacterioferritin
MMQIQEFIGLLNGDLALEYAAAIQYRQHAAVISGVYFAFAAELNTHADEELEHARKVAEMITWLGGRPAVDVAPRYTSLDNLAMLQQDLDGEQTAIDRYCERVAQAIAMFNAPERGGPLCGPVVIHDLQAILAEEASHRTDLKSMLGRS